MVDIKNDEYQIVGKAFVNGSIDNVTILIKNDKIVDIKKSERHGLRTLILKDDEILLPAMIDLHVHLRDWEQKYKEDIESGTKAAIKGGYTTIIEMPNTLPPLNTILRLEQRLEDLKSKSYVDYGIHFGIPDNLSELEKVAKKIIAIKLYPNDLKRIDEIFNIASKLNIKVAVHAEFNIGDEPLAVKYVLSKKPKSINLRFVHISRKESLTIIRNTSNNIFIEITPHHLLLSTDDVIHLPNGMKYVRPPIASQDDKIALYNALISGLINFIATDHAPHALNEKLSENPPPGFPGLEIALPLMITQWIKGTISLNRIIETMSTNPAKYLGINKGLISKGFYADLTIINFKTWKPVKASEFLSKAKYTPFENWSLTGWPTKVFIRGSLAYDSDNIFSVKGKHVLEL
jgi:dihydroorotase